MDWAQAAAAAVGGGVAAGIASLVATGLARVLPEGSRKTAVGILVVAAALIGSRFAGSFYEQRQNSPTQIESELLGDAELGRLAEAWRSAEPSSFQDATRAISESIRSGRERHLAINDLRHLLMSAAVPRMRHFDDGQMIETIRIARDEFYELARSNPETCEPMFNGRAFGDITDHISQDLRARELSLLEAAFRADTSVQRRALSGAELDAAIQRVLVASRDRVGDDVSLLTSDANTSGREARYCDAVVAFHEEILELPEPEAAALARGLR